MFSIILLCLYILPFMFSFFTKNVNAVSSLMTGAEDAVKFGISISGGICFWCAVTEIFERCSAVAAVSVLLRPVLKRLFPESSAHPEITAAISENISANLLGLGNAATPAGIRAVKKMAELGSAAKDELCTFVVVNTASIQLIPTSIAALRSAAGAEAPFDIVPAVWVSSALSLFAGLSAASVLKRIWR